RPRAFAARRAPRRPARGRARRAPPGPRGTWDRSARSPGGGRGGSCLVGRGRAWRRGPPGHDRRTRAAPAAGGAGGGGGRARRGGGEGGGGGGGRVVEGDERRGDVLARVRAPSLRALLDVDDDRADAARRECLGERAEVVDLAVAEGAPRRGEVEDHPAAAHR